jgi:hypothetical protein
LQNGVEKKDNALGMLLHHSVPGRFVLVETVEALDARLQLDKPEKKEACV